MILSKIFRIFWDADLQASKLTIAFASIFWAVVFSFPMSPHEILQYLAPPWLWGVLFSMHGTAMLYSLCLPSNAFLFIFGPLLGVLLWSALAMIMIFMGDSPSSVILAIVSIWIMIRWVGDNNHG